MASLTYAQWIELLCEHFFREERSGQPVTLFVDDDLLGDLEGSGDPEAGVASLVAAVKTRLTPDSFQRRFNRIDKESTDWKVAGGFGCPPSLPLLAVAVLAGTRMAREEGIGRNNYWRRFRDLLDFEQRDLKGINDVLPGLWEQLTWWLDEKHDGRLGLSTVQEDPWWTIIGYALSQALFRESDRQHLTELFRKIGLTPGEDIPSAELLQYFKAWAPGSSLSAGARHMAGDERYDDRLAALLADEAARWDGVLRDERGRSIGSIVLAFEPYPRPAYRMAAERPPGFPEHATFESSEASFDLSGLGDEPWYSESWDLEPRWLDEGLRLESDDYLLVLRPSPIIPLAQNQVLGCWAATPRLEPSQKYMVLAAENIAHEVEQFLATHALANWAKASSPGFAPRGWVLFTEVVIEAAPSETPDGSLSVLAPAVRERPTLRGGLLIDSDVGLYLRGGEPDVWLPSLLDEGTRVSVDGKQIVAAAGQRLSLRDEGLEAGNHEILVGASSLIFRTVESFRAEEAPGTGRVGHRLRRSADGHEAMSAGATQASPQEGLVSIAGARITGRPGDLPAGRTTIVLPLAAKRYRLVGCRPGEIEFPTERGRAAWLDSVGSRGLFPIGFEVYPSFEVVWVVVDRADRASARLRVRRQPDLTGPLQVPDERLNDWAKVFSDDVEVSFDAVDLWMEYQEAAEGEGRR